MPHEKEKTMINKAFEYNNPPIVTRTLLHSGVLPKWKSFLKIDKNAMLSAIIPKPNKTLIRLYEIQGQKAMVNISLNFSKELKIQKVDLTGQKIAKNLAQQGNSISTQLNPHEVACYAIRQ